MRVEHRVLLFFNGQPVVRDGLWLHSRPELPEIEIAFQLPLFPENTEQNLFVLELGAIPEDPEFEAVNLRSQLELQDEANYNLLARAAQITEWYRNHRFCSRCGAGLKRHQRELTMVCSACEATYYPRISPCVIFLVARGDRCLLAHNAQFAEGRYSVLAGFVEPGETPEAAVQREVFEEVGIRVKNIRYWKSQSWPFPHSLMLGFFADYDSGELTPDGVEITDAGWFDADHLPDVLPSPFALSRQLLDAFIASRKAGSG